MGTMPTVPPPMPPANGAPAISGSGIKKKLGKLSGEFARPRIVLMAVEGWGKTSYAAHAPDVAIIMARGETGYSTLLSKQRVPNNDAVVVDTWPELLDVLNDLASGGHGYQHVALDALGGIERLCHEFVCARDFGNDWGEKGFASYAKGYDVSISEWLKLISLLDKIHASNTGVIVLSHTLVRTYKNPLGEDFDRYVSDAHHKTWASTHKWADAVFFGNFLTIVDKQKGKTGKGIGGTSRVVYTERRDAYDAKNRYGMPEAIDIPNDPTLVYSVVNQFVVGQQ